MTLHLDILTYLLPYLESFPSTLATLCLLSSSSNPSATRRLYTSITLGGSPTTYQLFFAAHGSDRPPGTGPSPLRHTRHLSLRRHFLPADTSPYTGPETVTSLYAPLWDPEGVQLADLHLPTISSTLFPNLDSLHLDVHRTHLASILPILVTLNPVTLLISPTPFTPDETASAYIPHIAFDGYTRLETAKIISTDLHPPDSSDYPPYGHFPFPLPSLPRLTRVNWVYRATELERGFGRGFFQNLVGLFTPPPDDVEGAERVVGVSVTLRVGQGRMEDRARKSARGNLVRSLGEAGSEAGLAVVRETEEESEGVEGDVWMVGRSVRVTLRIVEDG